MAIIRFEVTEDAFTTALQSELEKGLSGLKAAVRLTGPKASRAELTAAFLKYGSFYLIEGMGHGNETHFFTNTARQEAVFSTEDANPETENAIVLLVSCNCGKELGAVLVADDDAKAFIGYVDYVTGPNNLALTQYFAAEPIAITIAIAQGKSQAEVWRAADTAYHAARAAIENDPKATSLDKSALEENHLALVGPWKSSAYGSF